MSRPAFQAPFPDARAEGGAAAAIFPASTARLCRAMRAWVRLGPTLPATSSCPAPSCARSGSAAVGGIRMLYQHDSTEPIGIWTRAARSGAGRGLVRGRLMLDVAAAACARRMMRAGALDGLSIGFKTVRARTDRRPAPAGLTEIDLWEISVVTSPMQPGRRARVRPEPAGGSRPACAARRSPQPKEPQMTDAIYAAILAPGRRLELTTQADARPVDESAPSTAMSPPPSTISCTPSRRSRRPTTSAWRDRARS